MVSAFSPQSAGDLNFLKTLNRSAVISHVRRYPGATRADIALHTQLTKATVGSVVQGLLDQGWLCEGDLQPRGEGRPGRALYLDDSHHVLWGADIGVKSLRIVACSLSGQHLIEHHDVEAPTTPEATMARLASLLNALQQRPEVADRETLGLGLTAPGPVSPRSPVLRLAPNIRWSDVALLDVLSDAGLTMPGVRLLDNEANAAAFGEFYFHTGTAPESLVYISAGTGIGSGLVAGDDYPLVLRGVQGLLGEIGHTILQPGGLYCHCGNRGCVETLVSGWAIRAALGLDDTADLAQVCHRQQYEPRVQHTLARAGEALGMLMLNLHHTLNPATIVLGGSLMRLGEALTQPALTYFQAHQNDLLRESQCIPIKLIEDSTFTAARGAAAQVMAKAVLDV